MEKITITDRETPEEVCQICKRTSYIRHCKNCLYNNLKKKWKHVEDAESGLNEHTEKGIQQHYDAIHVEKR